MKRFALMERDMRDGDWIDVEDADEFGRLRSYKLLKDVEDKKVIVLLAFSMPNVDDIFTPIVLNVGDILLSKPLEEVDLQDSRFRVEEVYGRNYVIFFDDAEFCSFSRAGGVDFDSNYDELSTYEIEMGCKDIYKNMRHRLRSEWAKMTFSVKKSTEDNDEYMDLEDLAFKYYVYHEREYSDGLPFGIAHLFGYNHVYSSNEETLYRRANGNSLVNLIDNPDVCAWGVDGGGSFVTVDLFSDEVYTELPDFLYQLRDYPIYDDDEWSRLEQEDLEEAYKDWIEFDLTRALQDYIDKEFVDAGDFIAANEVLPEDWAWQIESNDDFQISNESGWQHCLNNPDKLRDIFKDWVLRYINPEEYSIKAQMDASEKLMNPLLS